MTIDPHYLVERGDSKSGSVGSAGAAWGQAPRRSLNLLPEDWLWATWRPRSIQPPPAAKPPSIYDQQSPVQALRGLMEADADRRANPKARYVSIEEVPTTFRRWILPSMGESELDDVRGLVLAQLANVAVPATYYYDVPLAYELAAVVGLSAPLESVVAKWSPLDSSRHCYAISYRRPQNLVFGLGSAASVAFHIQRLRLPLGRDTYIRAWLAHTEFSELEYLAESIIHPGDIRDGGVANVCKEFIQYFVQTFGLAVAPDVAPHMLRLMLESKAPRAAREWLEAHPAETVHGLMPLLLAEGAMSGPALAYLKPLLKRGLEAELHTVVAGFNPADQARLAGLLFAGENLKEPFTDDSAPEAVRLALRAHKKLPRERTGWIGAADLPSVDCGNFRLSDSQVEAMLGALRQTGHPLTHAVRDCADPTSLEAFAWQVFEAWLANGGDPKEKWALIALGELGGDATALRLAPLIRIWPSEMQMQRAAHGLACLQRIGTDTALLQLNGIAQKVKSKALQMRAIAALEGVALERGLTRAQLEDRIVPDCGLGDHGSRTFDFGPRQFHFVLGQDMKPQVREVGDKQARPRPNLPLPNSKDDAARAEAAVAEWKLLKKQVTETIKIQMVRLEQAMVKERHWTPREFERLLVAHPVMTHLVRLLVWEATAVEGRAFFRVTEDGTYADGEDQSFDLSPAWSGVRIVHPLNMAANERRVWREILADYEIVPPFPQLERPTFALEGEEGEALEIERYRDLELQPQTLCFTLDKLDWERGPVLDGGGFHEHYKYFEAADCTACVVYEPGLYAAAQEWWQPQKLKGVYFVSGWRSKKGSGQLQYPSIENAVALGQVPAVAVSEVLKDLTDIVARGLVK